MSHNGGNPMAGKSLMEIAAKSAAESTEEVAVALAEVVADAGP